jgi:hypothetical protein
MTFMEILTCSTFSLTKNKGHKAGEWSAVEIQLLRGTAGHAARSGRLSGERAQGAAPQ